MFYPWVPVKAWEAEAEKNSLVLNLVFSGVLWMAKLCGLLRSHVQSAAGLKLPDLADDAEVKDPETGREPGWPSERGPGTPRRGLVQKYWLQVVLPGAGDGSLPSVTVK